MPHRRRRNKPAEAGCYTDAAGTIRLKPDATPRRVDRLLLDPANMFKHPRPLANFDYIGLHLYSLTWCCEARQHLFTQQDRVDLVRTQILRACQEAEIEVIADCFMPDHLHQLIRGASATADAKKFVRKAKQYSAFYFKKTFKEELWQRYGHDRFVRDTGDVRPIAKYILENPIRANLVGKVEDYPSTGSQVYTRNKLIAWAYS
jgi:putative transposase